MFGSQLPGEKNRPHYRLTAAENILNIHTVLPSYVDVRVLIDWKTLGVGGGGDTCLQRLQTRKKERMFSYHVSVCVADRLSSSHLSSIDREYSSVLRLGGGFAGGGGRRSAQFIALCLGSLGVRTPFF